MVTRFSAKIDNIQNDYFPGGKMLLAGVKGVGASVGRLLAMFPAKEQAYISFSASINQP